MFDTSHTERVFFDPLPPTNSSETWWSRYAGELKNLSPTARAAVETDCRYIVERGIFGDGVPGTEEWPKHRVRTGLVMGSVQSGKTASMLGVTALAIDRKVDIVVVLGGTRLSLWRQTYQRLTLQLDAGPENAEKKSRRLLIPSPGVVLSDSQTTLANTYRMAPAAVRRKLKREQPIIVVAMKQTDHLHALGHAFRESLYDAIYATDRPIHMLILDDEADDGSILDALVETGRNPAYDQLKQIPRAIANLWDPAQPPPSNLFTTYIGYTATPQANLLQEDHNPLAPRDFVVSLRTPLDIGHPVDLTGASDLDVPRSSTFPEPAGLNAFYTGGEVFYRRGAKANLCEPTISDNDEDLAEAVRAFLVAGAIRLYRSGRVGPFSATKLSFNSLKEAVEGVAPPHSMLIHPSATITDHFQCAEDILLWAGIESRSDARTMLESGVALLPDSLIGSVISEPAKWSYWLEQYQRSGREIELEFNLLTPIDFPDWATIESLLINEIIPGTRVSVVNSDPTADDRPLYEPNLNKETHKWHPARDLSTIFVSGNVMARGLTLEGLTTTLFQRVSNNPLADTQMQMQRWFGYRGSYIELCRVFAGAEQLDLFRAYHDIDEAVRVAITEKMANEAPDPVVLQGVNFLATGKIAKLGQRPLSPSSRPFIRLINEGHQPDPNAKTLTDLFSQHGSSDLTVGHTRGRIRSVPLSLNDAADLLDKLRYDGYNPGRDHPVALQWAQVEARLASIQPLVDPCLYRAPEVTAEPSIPHAVCPYSIAAYLRLWKAALTRPVRGLFVTGQPAELWSMSDLAEKERTQPRFWVGIRYGDGPPVSSGPLVQLPFQIRTTRKHVDGNELTTTWGTNEPNAGPGQYRGDEFFDYYHHHAPLPAQTGDSRWRPAGSDGLILFYVNQLDLQEHPTVAVGISIPAGGPEQFAATRAATLET